MPITIPRSAVQPITTTFTPSWTNVTVGSSTNVGQYTRMGRWIEFVAQITSAASFAITGQVALALPVTAAVAPSPANVEVWLLDAGTGFYRGVANGTSTTAVSDLIIWNASGTYAEWGLISATVPFTWGTGGDIIQVTGRYLAAT